MANKPSIKERSAERACPNCGGPVTRRSDRGPFPTFCSSDCKKDHSNRHIVEGRAVIAFLKAWRIDRAQGETARGSFEQVCQIVDSFNAQDRAANRPRADLYAAKLLADRTLFIDRKRGPRQEMLNKAAEAAATATA